MTYKYKDLVVIPKSVLEQILCYMPASEEFSRQAKPLLPIVESAFDKGMGVTKTNHNFSGYFDNTSIDKGKQEFLIKEIEL